MIDGLWHVWEEVEFDRAVSLVKIELNLLRIDRLGYDNPFDVFDFFQKFSIEYAIPLFKFSYFWYYK